MFSGSVLSFCHSIFEKKNYNELHRRYITSFVNAARNVQSLIDTKTDTDFQILQNKNDAKFAVKGFYHFETICSS